MNGEELKNLLDSIPYAEFLKKDNNEYLISYRLDSGAEVAFDPRTSKKCSIFVDKFPNRMSARLGDVTYYPPVNPSTALKRVSIKLSDTHQLYKIDLPDKDVAFDLLSWIRWA